MASTLDLLKRLNDHQVKYVLVGGMACVIHGSQIVTQDVDICAPLNTDNLSRLLAALAGSHPRFRMAADPGMTARRATKSGEKCALKQNG